MDQMQWRGWSTYSDIVAIWSWLDTEQSMINFTTEIVKVCVRECVCAYGHMGMCVCVWSSGPLWSIFVNITYHHS